MSTINGTPGDDILSTSTGGDFIDAGAGGDQVTLAFNPRSVWGPDTWDAGAGACCAGRQNKN